MNIENDLQIFTFSRFINSIENESEATKLLCDYWQSCGKLDKILMLKNIDSYNLSNGLKLDEIYFLVHAENCMEHLYKVLDGFLIAPYCSSETLSPKLDSDIEGQTKELISNLKDLKNIYLKGSWEQFCNQLGTIVAKIESTISVLIGSGKDFHFCTSANANQLISGDVSYDSKSGVFFVIDKQI